MHGEARVVVILLDGCDDLVEAGRHIRRQLKNKTNQSKTTH
jgi:hypothetical protein